MTRAYCHNLALAFERVAARSPQARALVYGPGAADAVSFATLNARANRIAGLLRDQGVGQGQVVALLNHKRVDGFAAMLACLKVGAAYTNLDDQNPRARLAHMVASADPLLALADETPGDAASQVFADAGVALVDLAGASDALAAQDAENRPEAALTPGDAPAYVMFTSGSTGTPKGVLISHQNVLNLIAWARQHFALTPADRLTNVNPIYFDNSVFDVYAALFNGAAMIPVDGDTVRNAQAMVAHVDACGATLWFSVPSLLIYALRMKALTPESFASLRVIAFGGEGFPKPKLRALHALYGHRLALHNVYGPTECTCICSAVELAPEHLDGDAGLAPLGPLAANFAGRVLDGDRPVAIDEPGELCLLGPQVGLGYVNAPERTAAAFTPDPLTPHYRRWMYRTGDLVRRDARGWLHFVGRKDHQIKHMGYRIELDEIEAAMNALGYVGEAAAVYHRDRPGADYGRILGFVATAEAGVDETRVRDDLRRALPDYMIPNRIRVLASLPKSANGKIDRRALLETETR
ncbi:hypothetical protein CCR85_02565 [Rhodothalassium salexigens]|uniref:amino acid adenylation domain-containing protein n=1 Tax=Rhodothalassium salexigens TaxID=1086 RepID=UPI00191231A6|nr:hypothetical protein [Rhodothalassium salexigens]